MQLSPEDSSVSVYLKTYSERGLKASQAEFKFDTELNKYRIAIGTLEKSIRGEIYIKYVPSKDVKAFHAIPFNYYYLNEDHYNPEKMIQVYSKNGTFRIDFVKHSKSILMPLIITTVEDIPGELPLNVEKRSTPFQVKFLDSKAVSFKAYVTFYFYADKNDTNMQILQFDEQNDHWVKLKTVSHNKGVNAQIEKLGYFILTKEVE